MRYNVFEFAGTGGVALAMYNTDAVRVASLLLLFTVREVLLLWQKCNRCFYVFCDLQSIRDFAHSSMQMALSKGMPLFMR